MKKLIDIDETTLKQLKLISAIENISVKGLIEKVVENFAQKKLEEKEDRLLLKLMLEAKDEENVSEEEFFEALNG